MELLKVEAYSLLLKPMVSKYLYLRCIIKYPLLPLGLPGGTFCL